MKKIIISIVLSCMLWTANSSFAMSTPLSSASDDSLAFSFNADFVNRYLWRGLLYSNNFNVQPYCSFAYKNFTIGAWGSFGISTPWAETDLYASLAAGPLVFTVSDYYVASDDSLENFNYFKYKKSETLHSFEGQVTYYGPESFPISLTAATFFTGFDDYDGDGDNDFSTYFEVAYTANVSGMPLKLFIGGTPKSGLYSDGADIVNIGINAIKKMKINENLEIPVFTSLVVNPAAKDMFFVFGITF